MIYILIFNIKILPLIIDTDFTLNKPQITSQHNTLNWTDQFKLKVKVTLYQ